MTTRADIHDQQTASCKTDNSAVCYEEFYVPVVQVDGAICIIVIMRADRRIEMALSYLVRLAFQVM